ncbi:ABC transporter permease [Kitasatospora sp. NPDC002965]|uniref:ABC transporter permease n=1 Tax=Kitasatospora sp. NPDC002965 TaxID=3154775 RepID=UPI0033BA914B
MAALAAAQDQLLPVTPALGVVTALLLAAAVAVAGWGRLGHGSAVLRAGLRAVVQLAAVAVVISWVAGSLGWSVLFVLLMFAVAVRTAGQRMVDGPPTGGGRRVRSGLRAAVGRGMPGGRRTAGAGAEEAAGGARAAGGKGAAGGEGMPGGGGRAWMWAAAPIGAGVLPVLALLLGTGLLPPEGLSVIPVSGILIGGALTATSLSGRRALDELRQRHGEVEAALALGFEERDARLEICRSAAATSLVPALDQTRTVGLVTLPGAFVGMLLGGASPVQAGAVQLFVLVGLLVVEAVAVVAVLELVGRGLVRAGRPGEGIG